MLGAIIGDVVGPIYEVLEVLYLKENKKQRPLKERIKVLDKNTPLFLEDCSMTDDSVPQAIYVFLESNDFEDAIRKAISIGGDSDTIASMTGAIAESYYGIPDWMKKEVENYIPEEYKKVINKEYEIKPFIKKKK